MSFHRDRKGYVVNRTREGVGKEIVLVDIREIFEDNWD